MANHHHVMAAAYYLCKALKLVGRPLGLVSANSLRVLLYHDIAPPEQERFATQLRWLSQSWKFISPPQFAAMIAGEEPMRGRNLLLTFDDGFASNRIVAEQVLNPLGIRALFFAISDFVALTNRSEARQFVARHIQPGRDPQSVPAHLYNMSWSDLEALLEQGHGVGAHTRTHARLSQIDDEVDLGREIVGSADTLERRLGVPVEHFAYTFGDVASFSEKAFAIAQRRFRFIHSGLRGDNAAGASPLAVRRDAATPQDSKALLAAYVEGVADWRYARSHRRLVGWL